MSTADVPFQLSQRADFFEEEVGLETTLKRPIVNTRDEPHCDPQKYRRLHVIVGDANMSEVATYLKVGTTAIVLSMIEDDELGTDLAAGQPGAGDPPGQPRPDAAPARSRSRGGRRATALEIQWSLLERARKYERVHGLGQRRRGGRRRRAAPLGGGAHRAGARPDSVATIVDWVAKQRLVDGYADRHGLEPGDARLKALDLQYHDMRPGKCLADRVGLER